ncbi:MAG: hypothetical protein NT085_02740 [candidate division SR1 bacterium]|nr:hypothetical protein [candidate division SR1 bacterium]
MSKKDYILKVLDTTMDYFPLARGLKILISGEALDDTAIDTLVSILTKTMNEITDGEAKRKLQKSKDFLEKLKTIEQQSHLRDEKSIAMLDDMLKNI